MSLASSTYIVGEEDAVVAVLGDGVDPGVGDESHRAAPRHVVEGDGLEEELGGVVVLDDDGARRAQLLHLPVEGHAELGLAVGRQRRQARQPLLQVRLGAHLAAVAVVCTQHAGVAEWCESAHGACRRVAQARARRPEITWA